MDGKKTRTGTGILAGDMAVMTPFYRDVLGLDTDWDGGDFAEFHTASGDLALFMYSRKAFSEAFGLEYQHPRASIRPLKLGCGCRPMRMWTRNSSG